MIISFFSAITFIISIIVFFIIYTILVKPFYIYFFEHQDWKLWRYYLKIPDDKFIEDLERSTRYARVFKFKELEFICWLFEGGECSVHQGFDCILSSFDKYHSRKMYQKLVNKK